MFEIDFKDENTMFEVDVFHLTKGESGYVKLKCSGIDLYGATGSAEISAPSGTVSVVPLTIYNKEVSFYAPSAEMGSHQLVLHITLADEVKSSSARQYTVYKTL